MSDTPKLADECKRLLDNGWTVAIYRNGLGSYTAVGWSSVAREKVQESISDSIEDYEDEDGEAWKSQGIVLTDDFEPSQALYRLTEKVFGNIV